MKLGFHGGRALILLSISVETVVHCLSPQNPRSARRISGSVVPPVTGTGCFSSDKWMTKSKSKSSGLYTQEIFTTERPGSIDGPSEALILQSKQISVACFRTQQLQVTSAPLCSLIHWKRGKGDCCQKSPCQLRSRGPKNHCK